MIYAISRRSVSSPFSCSSKHPVKVSPPYLTSMGNKQFRGHSQKTEISKSQPSPTLTKQQWDIRDAQLGMDTHIPDVQVNHKSNVKIKSRITQDRVFWL